MSSRCRIDAKSTLEEGKARRIRGWGPGGLCLINPSQVYTTSLYITHTHTPLISLRAQRLKKNQSRLKCSISLEIFHLAWKFGVVKTVLLANGHFAWLTPATFVIFVDLRVWGAKSLFLWVEWMHYRNFADFRQNHLFSAGDKTTVLRNDRFDNPEKISRSWMFSIFGPLGLYRDSSLLRSVREGPGCMGLLKHTPYPVGRFGYWSNRIFYNQNLHFAVHSG